MDFALEKRMKLQTFIWLLAVTTCLQVGCQTVDLKPELRSDKYTITAVIVESDVISTESEWQAELENILKRKNSKVTRMPTVHLLPGDNVEIDEQKLYTFPISFNPDGTVKEEKAVAIGKLIRIVLHGSPEMKVSVFLDDTVVTEWRDVRLPLDKSFRYPTTRRRFMKSDISPQLSTWHILGKSDGVVFAVRVDPPTR